MTVVEQELKIQYWLNGAWREAIGDPHLPAWRRVAYVPAGSALQASVKCDPSAPEGDSRLLYRPRVAVALSDIPLGVRDFATLPPGGAFQHAVGFTAPGNDFELICEYELRDDGKTVTGTSNVRSVSIMSVRVDLAAKGHDFSNPATGNVDVPEETEETEGAYIHFNCDNDDESLGGTAKYPGGDFLQTGPIPREDDLKSIRVSFVGEVPTTGELVLRRTSSAVQVWGSPRKGQESSILTGDSYRESEEGNGRKTWNLSVDAERRLLEKPLELYVEGREPTSSAISISFEVGGCAFSVDTVRYTAFAATCGDQPTIEQRRLTSRNFPNLVHCEWSVTGPADSSYNCIAWSVDEPHAVYLIRDIDIGFGSNFGTFEDSDMDSFYRSKKRWNPVASDQSDAEAIFFSFSSSWTYDPLTRPPGPGFHAARRKYCGCGAGKLYLFESKLGVEGYRIEHVWNQIEGGPYGSLYRFYK